MKAILGFLKLCLAALVVLVIAAGAIAVYEFQTLGKAKTYLADALSEELKVAVSFKDISVDWYKLLRLSPSVSARSIVLSNPPGFRSEYLASIKSLEFELDFIPLLAKNIKINKIIIKEPLINLEQNSAAKLNLDTWLMALDKSTKAKAAKAAAKKKSQSEIESSLEEAFQVEKIILDQLLLKDGQLMIVDYSSGRKEEIFRIRDVNIKSYDFQTDKASEITADFTFFDAHPKSAKYRGTIGPITEHSMPSSGDFNAELWFQDIPRAKREQYLGNLVLEPRKQDRLLLNASIKGDLFNSVKGDGFIDLNKIRMGKSKKHNIFVEGHIPVSFSVLNLLGLPKLYLSTDRTVIVIDKDGELRMNSKVSVVDNFVQGNLAGSLQGVDINKILSAFTPNEDQLYGKFEIPNFNLNFNGRDADAMTQSLRGDGFISIKDGYLNLFGQIYKLQGLLKSVTKSKDVTKKKDVFAKKIETHDNSNPEGLDEEELEEAVEVKTRDEFSKFALIETPFKIVNQKFKTSDIKAVTPLGKINGSGYYAFDQRIKYDFTVKLLSRDWPVKMRGTAEKPKASVDIESVAKEEFSKQLDAFFGSKKKTEKVKETSGSSEQLVDAATGTSASQEANAETTSEAVPTKKKKKKKKKGFDGLFDSALDLGMKELQKQVDKRQ